MTKAENKALHYILLAITLLAFSKLSFDAVLLGALAIYFYQKGKRDD